MNHICWHGCSDARSLIINLIVSIHTLQVELLRQGQVAGFSWQIPINLGLFFTIHTAAVMVVLGYSVVVPDHQSGCSMLSSASFVSLIFMQASSRNSPYNVTMFDYTDDVKPTILTSISVFIMRHSSAAFVWVSFLCKLGHVNPNELLNEFSYLKRWFT